ncbi:MAG: PssD/Cps14F family polysaccharide biosynthesis glycosyltransferase [Acholeplasmatales bacterium]
MNKENIILISSSGGHFEQLKQLKDLSDFYNLIWVTEKTKYDNEVDYKFPSIKLKSILFPFKYIISLFKSHRIIKRYKPVAIISTGALVSIPLLLVARRKKIKTIFIETFARVTDSTKTGKFLYDKVDLFIIQWETLKEVYPNSVYGGGLY